MPTVCDQIRLNIALLASVSIGFFGVIADGNFIPVPKVLTKVGKSQKLASAKLSI
jgi:hypothetical protein